jgi:hypothetical protein
MSWHCCGASLLVFRTIYGYNGPYRIYVRIDKVGIQVSPSTKGGRNVLTLYARRVAGWIPLRSLRRFTAFRMTSKELELT